MKTCSKSFLGSCVQGKYQEVKQMVEQQTDYNQANQYGTTGLMAACGPKEQVEVIKYLLSLPNININTQNSAGHSALHKAAWYGQLQACQMLINAGANYLLKDSIQKTPLNLAQENNYYEVIQYLTSVEQLNAENKQQQQQ